jgi:hypothetical protein
MKLYKIGYGTYEESEYRELGHYKTFTHDEITEMVADGVVWAIKYYKERDKQRIHNFQDAFDLVIKYLIKKEGFVEIEYDMFWSIFGWTSVWTKENNWNTIRGQEEDVIIDKVLAAGFDPEEDDPMSDTNTERLMKRLKEKKNE